MENSKIEYFNYLFEFSWDSNLTPSILFTSQDVSLLLVWCTSRQFITHIQLDFINI